VIAATCADLREHEAERRFIDGAPGVVYIPIASARIWGCGRAGIVLQRVRGLTVTAVDRRVGRLGVAMGALLRASSQLTSTACKERQAQG